MSWFVRRQLKSKSAHLRRQALHQLRGQPAGVVVPLIESLLATENDRSVLLTAMGILGCCRESTAPRRLVGQPGSPEPAVQLSVVGVLAPLLTNSDPVVRGRTAQLLRQLGWQPKSKTDEAAYLVALGDIHRAAFLGAAAVGALTSVLGDTAFQRRVQAVNRLAEIGDPAAVEPLIRTLLDKDDVVRLAAADALGRLGDGRATSALLPLLKDQNPGVRTAAAGALGALGDAKVVDPLMPVLRDSHWEARVATLESLGRLRDPKATEAVADCLRDPDREVREKAAECLGILGDATAVGPLVGALVDEDKFVRQWARLALQRINPRWETLPEAQGRLDVLRAAARSDDFGMRYAAEEALQLLENTMGVAGSRGSEPGRVLMDMLAEFLGDPDASVRQAAVEALARLPDAASQQFVAPLREDADASVAAGARGMRFVRQTTDRADCA
jgi:HEAT repeat protein